MDINFINALYKTERTIEQMYLDGMSLRDISSETLLAVSTVRLRLKKIGVLRARTDGIRLAASQGKVKRGLGKNANRG